MPDSWEILKANSSLPFGDAWEHLNAQEGSGACSAVFNTEADVIIQELTADIVEIISADVIDEEVTADVVGVLSADTEQEELTVGVCS